jgi:hypothetical protein
MPHGGALERLVELERDLMADDESMSGEQAGAVRKGETRCRAG